MLIDLRSALHSPCSFGFSLEPDWWGEEDESGQILGLDGPLTVHMVVSKVRNGYILEGELYGGVLLRCGRCVEAYHTDLASEFRLLLTQTPAETGTEELELREDDMWVDFVSGDKVDIDNIIRGQIYLALPMNPLCSEDCAGLCPECGCNLNLEECSCIREKGHPGFLKLKELKTD